MRSWRWLCSMGDGRWDTETRAALVLGGEFAVVVDSEVARIVLGFNQINVESAVDHQMIDLRHITVDHHAQVVDDHVVVATFEILIEVVGGILLALDTLAHARQPSQ